MGCASQIAETRATLPEPARAPRTARLELEVRQSGAGVALELRNAGEETVRLPSAHARLDVRAGGEPERACEAERRAWVPLSTRGVTLAPGEAHRSEVSLDCLLADPGAHTVLAEVVLGGAADPREPAPLAEHLAASGTIVTGPGEEVPS